MTTGSRWWLFVAVVAGGVAGLVLGLQLGRPPDTGLPPAGPSSQTLAPGAPTTPPGTRPTTASTVELMPAPPSGGMALVWSPARLPGGLAEAAAGVPGVTHVMEVVAGQGYLAEAVDATGRTVDTRADGAVIPVEIVGMDPDDLAGFDPSASEALAAGDVLLTESSAQLRRLGPGGTLTMIDGSLWQVDSIVPDPLFGAAEVVMARTNAEAVGSMRPRYLLIAFEGDRGRLEAAIREAAGGATLRFRGPGETPYLRHGDAVLPQSRVKLDFGEFRLIPVDGGFEIDPVWAATNIETAEVPILGRITCHRALLPILADVMAELEAAGWDDLVDPEGFRGCYNPRFVAGSTALSRHSWGIALDVNYVGNEQGQAASIDPRLVEVFRDHGFGWGGEWLIPDPAHFEWIGD